MGIEHIIDGDYQGAIVDAGKAITAGANNAGEQAMKAIKARMAQEAGGPQHVRDTHGQAQGQNNGREQQQRKDPVPATPAPGR